MENIDVILNDYDNRLVEMYLTLYNTAKIACYGNEWIINTEDGTVEFKGYKGFINFVESEVKNSLLCYAFNNELRELIDIKL